MLKELTDENQQLSSRLLNKRAQDSVENSRERGLADDLKVEQARNIQLGSRVKELEQVNTKTCGSILLLIATKFRE